MCYLKNLSGNETLDFEDIFSKGEETTLEQPETEVDILIPEVQRYAKPQISR